jgi:hypothetical protein
MKKAGSAFGCASRVAIFPSLMCDGAEKEEDEEEERNNDDGDGDDDANMFGCLCRMYNSLLGESGRGESVGRGEAAITTMTMIIIMIINTPPALFVSWWPHGARGGPRPTTRRGQSDVDRGTAGDEAHARAHAGREG